MPRRILLLEDDLSVARLLALYLRRAGWEVVVASSVAEARQLAGDGEWEIAILDGTLPDGAGADLCRELRAASPDAYIMIVSGDESEEARLRGLGSGADDYLPKPFAAQELLGRLSLQFR